MGANWSRLLGTGLVVLATLTVTVSGKDKDEKKKITVTKKEERELSKQLLAFNSITGTEPLQGELATLLKDRPGTLKLLHVATLMVKGVELKDVPFNHNTTRLLALAASNLKEVDTAIVFHRLNGAQSLRMASEHGLAQAYLGMIATYASAKRYEDCEKICKQFLTLNVEDSEEKTLDEFKPVVLRQLILLMAKRGSVDKAIAVVDGMLEESPDNWELRATKAEVYREAGKFKEAAAVYLDIIKRVDKIDKLKKAVRDEINDEYRYALAGLYIELNDVKKASEQLKSLLTRHPTNATFLNDLGYIWADHGMNLAEAEKMIRKALAEDKKKRRLENLDQKDGETKENASFLDSLGWVLFKRGKYKEAKVELLKAIKDKEGQSIEVYDHLGDVYQALGEKADAESSWKKAIEAATKSKRDQKRKTDIQKKLKKDDK